MTGIHSISPSHIAAQLAQSVSIAKDTPSSLPALLREHGMQLPGGTPLTLEDARALRAALTHFHRAASMPPGEKILLAFQLGDEASFEHALTLMRLRVVDPHEPIEVRAGKPRQTIAQCLILDDPVLTASMNEDQPPVDRVAQLRRLVNEGGVLLERSPPSPAQANEPAITSLAHSPLRCALAMQETAATRLRMLDTVIDVLRASPQTFEHNKTVEFEHERAQPLPVTTDAEVFDRLIEHGCDALGRLVLKTAVAAGDDTHTLNLLSRLDDLPIERRQALLANPVDGEEGVHHHASDNVFRALLDRGLDSTSVTAQGRNVFHVAQDLKFFEFHRNQVRDVFFARANREREINGMSVLWVQLFNQASNEMTAFMNKQDRNGRTPWEEASRAGRYNICAQISGFSSSYEGS
ncbi:MAG TPA: hypothetical protein VFS42_08785 [Burkholderiaceae bacterium]|nr:hypothetical protein [Burkholderiaceae bacterium]